MDNYCNEIGQKMRSAVKAKLLELGTGGSAGYIDDELPDYVMIMVANKRSKQQMIADLNLFLGTQTELFVIWLHEVLQKLQEVTLPAASVAKKRKSSQKDEASSSAVSSNKKEKKVSKKEKHPVAKKSKDNISTTPERNATIKPPSSITDIFAEELLEKAKQNLDLQADANLNIKKTKGRKTPEDSVDNSSMAEQTGKVTNEFDIPTISEISSTTCGGNSAVAGGANNKESNAGNSREKDLAELAEIQKKIYAAKKQLKQLGELDEDEDFLNLRDDDSREAFNEAGDLVRKDSVTPPATQQSKKKSPIVFDRNSTEKLDQETAEPGHNEDNNDEKQSSSKRKRFTPPPQLSSATAAASTNTNSTQSVRNEKRPVHERLGVKTTTIASNPKEQRSLPLAPRERRKILQEKELYVPAFRRKEMERERERERERSRECERGARERGRERERRIDRSRDRDRDNSKVRSRQSRSLEEHIKRRSNSDVSRAEERNSSQVRKITTTTPASGGRARSSSADASPETTTNSATTTHRRRIGSRVIIAPVKAIEPSDEEELNDKPVNSVIKIKPRPPMSPSKQAPKNLLLRAVAEAQRSTILNKPVVTTNAATTPTKSKVSLRLGERVQGERNTKLYTKSYRDRLKNLAGGMGALFRRTTQNLIVEVNGSGNSSGGGSKQKYKLRLDNENEEYIPESVSDRGESDQDYVYVPQTIRTSEEQEIDDVYEHPEPDYEEGEDGEVRSSVEKTQFVVTLNEDKALPKLKRHTAATRYSRSLSPPPQVSSSSSSSRDREPTSTSNSNHARKASVKERLSLKGSYSSSHSSAEPKSLVSRHEATTPPLRRTELVEIYRKHKDIQKIIIKNDSEDDDMSPTKKSTPDKDKKLKRKHDDIEYKSHKLIDVDGNEEEENNNDSMRSTTPPLKDQLYQKERSIISSNTNATSTSNSPLKRKHTPIKFDLTESRRGDNDGERSCNSPITAKRRRSSSREKEHNRERERERNSRQSREKDRDSSHERREEKRKISIRNSEAKKYDNIPSSLNSVSVDSGAYRSLKPKERCKYHPNCTKTFCEYYHPSAPCKSFPNCKYADKCMYSHPKCKYDLACVNLDCNFSHSGPRRASLLESSAPPLSSHVVPVQNYKSISATTTMGPVSSTTCKYFPNCTKSTCPFYHPKPCRYGKNCINKFECLFSHQELPSSSKFKWVASIN
ncbi:nuclear polyadenosine RNA-binding 2 [Glossina fuscipes fuscipes]